LLNPPLAGFFIACRWPMMAGAAPRGMRALATAGPRHLRDRRLAKETGINTVMHFVMHQMHRCGD